MFSLLFAEGPGLPIENRGKIKAPALTVTAVVRKFLRFMVFFC